MNTTKLSTRTARHAKIIEITLAQPVTSQGELRTLLAQEGIEVTQATLSRDLEELYARKETTTDGRRVYRIPSPEDFHAANTGALAQLRRWLPEVLVSARYVNNQIILKTPPGAAQVLASAIDRAVLSGVLGCIAGDDTVLMITDSAERALNLVEDFITMAGKGPRQ